MRRLQELDVLGRVHAQHRLGTELVRRADLAEVRVGDRGVHPLGALGDLRRRDEPAAVVDRVARMMTAMEIGRDREHG